MNRSTPSTKPALATLAVAAAVAFSSCSGFNINVGTKEPIKLDPIKFEPIDLNMRVDVHQYSNTTKEEKQAVENVENAVENQRNRMKDIQTLKNSRYVGENHLGLLTIHDLPAGDNGEWVRDTVDEENADRAFLMTDKSNSSGTALAAIRRQQWEARTQNSFKGELIEVAGGAPDTYRWVQKKDPKKK
jgi:hypothetical protein